MGKLIYLFVLALFFVPLVVAQPPTQSNLNQDFGLDVAFQKFDYFKNGEPFNLSIHNYNRTDGKIVINATCELEIYNKSGYHLIDDLILTQATEENYVFIEAGNFTTDGLYHYNIYCFKGGSGGFVDGVYTVNSIGEELTVPKAVTYIGFFAIFIFLFVINFFGIGLLPASNTKDEQGVLMSISYLKYFRGVLWMVQWALLISILFISSNIAFAYMGEQLVAKFFFVLFRITTGLTPVILAVWIMWIYSKIVHDKGLKEMMRRGTLGQHGGTF